MPSENTTVFVTSHGSYYHKSDEHRYTGSGKAYTTLSKAAAMGYSPCGRCFTKVVAGRNPTPQFLYLYRKG